MNGEVRVATRCRFLTAQKAAEKRAATSEARGTALGLHAPETPKGEVESEKAGKNAWRDCFSIGFSDSPPLIRGCPNPRGANMFCF